MAYFQDQGWDDNDRSHQVSQHMNLFQLGGVGIVGISILTCTLCRKKNAKYLGSMSAGAGYISAETKAHEQRAHTLKRPC